MWEVMMSGLVLAFITQSSSFFMSLLLVPLSVIVMLFAKMNLVSSGFWVFLFVMVFIGGLLILLVSVTSTSSQDMGLRSPSLFILLLILVLVNALESIDSSEMVNSLCLMTWMANMTSLNSFLLVLLVLELMVITWNMSLFKSSFRSLCL